MKHGLDTFQVTFRGIVEECFQLSPIVQESSFDIKEVTLRVCFDDFQSIHHEPMSEVVQVAASKFTESKTLHPIPEIKLSEWKGIANSKVITSNSSSFCKFAIETDALIKNIADGLKAYVENGKTFLVLHSSLFNLLTPWMRL